MTMRTLWMYVTTCILFIPSADILLRGMVRRMLSSGGGFASSPCPPPPLPSSFEFILCGNDHHRDFCPFKFGVGNKASVADSVAESFCSVFDRPNFGVPECGVPLFGWSREFDK